MKINKLFHWLYFSVMMLPIFILPIFALAVRSDNNYQSIHIYEEQKEVIDFNQLTESIDGPYYDFDVVDNYIIFEEGYTNGADTSFPYLSEIINLTAGHVYVIRSESNYSSDGVFRYASSGAFDYLTILPSFNDSNRFVATSSADSRFVLRIPAGYSVPVGFYLKSYCFDLTQMFGEGNEPDLDTFDNLIPVDNYSYITSEKILINTGVDVLYNDEDFASQMVYTMYEGVNKYFNYDSVFNFGFLYDWLQLTFFNGNATLGFFIMWHLLIYWLLTSLLWLLFDVLMYVPNLIHRWLDKASLD